MFGVLVYDILFFAIPAVLLTLLGISIYRYVSAKKKNQKTPGAFSPNVLITRKIIMIITAVITGVLLIIVIGFILLLLFAVAFM